MNNNTNFIDCQKRKCNLCNKCFSTKQKLEQHILTKAHNKRIEELAVSKTALLIKAEKKIAKVEREKDAEIEELKRRLADKERRMFELHKRLGKVEAERDDAIFVITNKIGGKALEQYKARKAGYMDFADVDYSTLYDCRQSLLKENLGQHIEGDLAIIKALYIDDFDKERRPVMLADYSRKKFKIRKNGIWVGVHARRIATEYIQRITPLYSRILKQKENDHYELLQKYREDIIELTVQDSVFQEMWKQKNVHYTKLCTDKYLKELISGLTSLFGESTQ